MEQMYYALTAVEGATVTTVKNRYHCLIHETDPDLCAAQHKDGHYITTGKSA